MSFAHPAANGSGEISRAAFPGIPAALDRAAAEGIWKARCDSEANYMRHRQNHPPSVKEEIQVFPGFEVVRHLSYVHVRPTEHKAPPAPPAGTSKTRWGSFEHNAQSTATSVGDPRSLISVGNAVAGLGSCTTNSLVGSFMGKRRSNNEMPESNVSIHREPGCNLLSSVPVAPMHRTVTHGTPSKVLTSSPQAAVPQPEIDARAGTRDMELRMRRLAAARTARLQAPKEVSRPAYRRSAPSLQMQSKGTLPWPALRT